MLLDRDKCLDEPYYTHTCDSVDSVLKIERIIIIMAEEISETASGAQPQDTTTRTMTTCTQNQDNNNECGIMNKNNTKQEQQQQQQQQQKQQQQLKETILEEASSGRWSKKKPLAVASIDVVPPTPMDIFTGNTGLPAFICECPNPESCISLKNILNSFNAPLSEEQAWALIYQSVKGIKDTLKRKDTILTEADMPQDLEDVNVHNDGAVHVSSNKKHGDHDDSTTMASHKKILRKLGLIVYTALDYNLQAEYECLMSQELEQLISHMTADDADDDCIDEGIDEGYKRWDDESECMNDEKCNNNETKDLDYVLEACTNHVKPTVPEEHYKAVCRALVTEALELRIFLQKVFNNDTEALRRTAGSVTSEKELAQLGFNDWNEVEIWRAVQARFWVQVVEELRQGVRLKKKSFSRTPVEFELTPYEILMEDIRTRKYNLRKVMVNGDIPPRVKKDAHALILEFIRSRPPLKKASERKLPPPIKRTPSPREQLMDSIRKGQQLKHIDAPEQPLLKDRLLPPPSSSQAVETLKREEKLEAQCSPRSKQRLIKVDFSLIQDDKIFDDSPASGSSSIIPHTSSICSQPKMPPYPIGGYMPATGPAPTANLNSRVMRRTKDTHHTITEDEYHRFFDNALESYDLATQCESRRASMRRHTIVGCQSNLDETHSMPASRPDSRQSDVQSIAGTDSNTKYQPHHQHNNNLDQSPGGGSSCSRSSSIGAWTKSFLDEKHWRERGDDRLSLTLEEIVHIRSVMTKAELEGLPVGVRVKEDVERRKVCFLCLRTRFSIFGPWGIQCKLCQRTVCSKCYTKMRIPTEHFRNVPVVLISPSLLSSPAGSSTPSPSHHAHINAAHASTSILDESFPKSLIERLLRSESERKTRNSVGSAPSSPKHLRSNMSTPGSGPGPHEMTKSMITAPNGESSASGVNGYNKENQQNGSATNKNISIMSRSVEGPRSLPVSSPARPHSNSSTLDRKTKFARAFTLSSSGHLSSDQKENLRGELMAVCNDCEGLLLEIIRSSKQTRSSARNRALKNLTLDLSPVYKR